MSDVSDPALSVVFPCYNEERRLAHGLDRATDYLRSRGEPYEILVVDDGSRDGTRALAEKRAAADPSIHCYSLGVNRGKGAAVREGMLRARGRWILMSDIDLSAPIEEIGRLEALRGRADVMIASRARPGSRLEVRQPPRREFLGRAFNVAVRLAALPGLFDTQCGFKLWSREAAARVFRRVRLERFAFDVESLWLARRLGFRVAEVAVRWRHDDRSAVRPLRDGARMGMDLLRILLRRTLLG